MLLEHRAKYSGAYSCVGFFFFSKPFLLKIYRAEDRRIPDSDFQLNSYDAKMPEHKIKGVLVCNPFSWHKACHKRVKTSPVMFTTLQEKIVPIKPIKPSASLSSARLCGCHPKIIERTGTEHHSTAHTNRTYINLLTMCSAAIFKLDVFHPNFTSYHRG